MANDNSTNSGTSNRGFASMDDDKQREIASKGGKASGGQFGKPGGADPSKAGRKGGKSSRSGGNNTQ